MICFVMLQTISKKLPANRRWLAALCLALTLLAWMAPAALADDEPEVYDARLLGYDKTTQLDSSSTALIWLLLIVLIVLCVGVMFKDARRSHLD